MLSLVRLAAPARVRVRPLVRRRLRSHGGDDDEAHGPRHAATVDGPAGALSVCEFFCFWRGRCWPSAREGPAGAHHPIPEPGVQTRGGLSTRAATAVHKSLVAPRRWQELRRGCVCVRAAASSGLVGGSVAASASRVRDAPAAGWAAAAWVLWHAWTGPLHVAQ